MYEGDARPASPAASPPVHQPEHEALGAEAEPTYTNANGVHSDNDDLVFDAEASDGGPEPVSKAWRATADAPNIVSLEKEKKSKGLERGTLTVAAASTSSTDSHNATPSAAREEKENDDDEQAEAMVIDSLRAQVQDLFSQVTQLNSKLVRSYDRVSDLEDDLHVASANSRSSALKIAQLEMERTQHLSALNTGLLVERSAVAAELTRVMERATDEAARAGKAESAREEIERELDDLSAGLFNQANNMVAQARFAQAGSERKVEEAETALRAAEDAVAAMQTHVQALQQEKEKAVANTEQMQMRMGKGKWIEREAMAPNSNVVRLLSSHNPYQEFLLFVAHLRSIRPSTSNPPAMSTLLTLPFLTRLQSEDSDPTVRLDLAPALNWLSRRSVLGAIHNGELTIEPMSASALIEELSSPNYSSASIMAGSTTQPHNISCALCGTSIFPAPSTTPGSPQPPLHPAISRTASNTGWSTSLFKNALTATNNIVAQPNRSSSPSQMSLYQERPFPTQVFIFRITATQPSTSASTTSKSMYPLCASGWCLARLRTTCSLWAFVRAALVERVWEEPIPELMHAPVPKRATSRDSTVSSLVASVLPGTGDKQVEKVVLGAKPPLPVRKSKIGGFWGRASNAISAGVAQVSQVSRSATNGSTPTPTEDKDLPTTPPRMARASSIPRTPASPSPRVNESSPTPLLPQRSENRKSRAVTPVPPAEPPSASLPEFAPLIAMNDASSAAPSTPIVESPAFLTPNQDPPTDPMQAIVVPEIPSVVPSMPSDVPPSVSAAPLSVAPAIPNSAPPIAPAVAPPPATEAVAPPVTTVEADVFSTSAASNSVPESNASLHPPSRTASPAPVAAPVLPARSAARTASPAPTSPGGAPGTPPPIPRRAAARAPRPISLVAQAVSNAHTTAEASPLETVPPHPLPIGVERPVQNATPSVPEGQVVPPSITEDVAPPQQIASEASSTPVPVDEPVAAPIAVERPPSTEAGLPVEVAPEVALDVTSEKSAAESIVAETPFAPKANGENAEELTTSVVADAKSVVTTAAPTAPAAQSEEPQSKIAEEDGEVYVGDATWEERAWKELARLREDMFWARVGGVR